MENLEYFNNLGIGDYFEDNLKILDELALKVSENIDVRFCAGLSPNNEEYIKLRRTDDKETLLNFISDSFTAYLPDLTREKSISINDLQELSEDKKSYLFKYLLSEEFKVNTFWDLDFKFEFMRHHKYYGCPLPEIKKNTPDFFDAFDSSWSILDSLPILFCKKWPYASISFLDVLDTYNKKKAKIAIKQFRELGYRVTDLAVEKVRYDPSFYKNSKKLAEFRGILFPKGKNTLEINVRGDIYTGERPKETNFFAGEL